MNGAKLHIHATGPGVSVQDQGRPGYLALGLSAGGAADRLALAEGGALLGQGPQAAALEMAGSGGTFSVSRDTRIALTGAPMGARVNDSAVAWNSSHLLPAGAMLHIGGARAGSYGYLHLGGGVNLAPRLGARAAHLAAGLGRPLQAGDTLPLGPDTGDRINLTLDVADRFSGGLIRVLPGFQTPLFSAAEQRRFVETAFTRGPRANRMGARLDQPGPGFAATGQLNILSEIIVPGDIQITGDGTPVVLLCECQTTGGYPRIGSVIEPDLAKMAQAPAGAPIRFQFVTRATALTALRAYRTEKARLPDRLRPRLRDPRAMNDLLSYQLIDGAISALDFE